MKKYILGSICDFNLSSITKADKLEVIKYLDTGNIAENKIDTMVEYPISYAPSRAKRKVQHNTVIYYSVRPNQKYYGIMKYSENNMVVSTGFITMDIKKEYQELIYP